MSSTDGSRIRAHLDPGIITRVSGPILEARGLASARMYEMVRVGRLGLVGEVVRLRSDCATIQVYENTEGLVPGEPVECSGEELSVSLGPGLLGTIYDGFQRRLREIAEQSGHYIRRGETSTPLSRDKKWDFIPSVGVGQVLRAGSIFGTVRETTALEHHLMLSPFVEGRVVRVVQPGSYTVDDTLLEVETSQGTRTVPMATRWPVRKPRPVASRRSLDTPLLTGMRVIDTFFPITLGGTAAIPGGFGTGKTIAQQALAKWCAADIIVYIGCGERGNEMAEVLRDFPRLHDPRTGQSLMERSVLIANVSNMPVSAREVSIYTGITIAEYYRDMGYHVAVMADSTSRWAEALREISSRLEEMPADEGFPAYLPARLADFYERGGKVQALSGEEGSVSVIGAISPPGGDFSEPVTQHTSRYVRCFWALDPTLANARHYPALSWLTSYSEYLPEVERWWAKRDPQWDQRRACLMRVLQEEVKLQRIAKLVGPDALPESQRLTLFLSEIIKNAFLQQNSFDPVDASCSPQKQIALLHLLGELIERAERFVSAGGVLSQVRDMRSLGGVVRAKSTVTDENLVEISEVLQGLREEFEQLERGLSA